VKSIASLLVDKYSKIAGVILDPPYDQVNVGIMKLRITTTATKSDSKKTSFMKKRY
jgi:hypothetical protein